jgi:multiple sugar transport system substrate-binding protein
MQPKSPARLLLFSTSLAALVAGCTPPPPVETEVARPLAGKTVRVACPAAAPAAVVQAYSRAWASREGAKVEVTVYPPGGTPGQADVWVLPPPGMSRRAAAGDLRPLPAALTNTKGGGFEWTELLPIYRERLLLWQGTPYAVPLLGESPLCVYRADLFADPARGEAFRKKYGRPLAEPKTWEEFAELAEFFRDTAPGGPAPSLPPRPATPAGLDREFFTIAACYARRAMSAGEGARDDKEHQLFSFQYDHRTGKPRLTEPGFVYALELMKRLQKCRPDGTSATPGDAFRDGRAKLALADAHFVASLQQVPGMADKAGVCRMPGGGRYFDYVTGKEVPAPDGNRVPYLGGGGWLAAVPKVAAEPDAAFGLLADLAGKERSGQIVIDPKWGGGPTRRDHTAPATRWDSFGLDPARTKELKDAVRQTVQHPSVLNPAVRLRTTTEGAHEEVLLKRIEAFLKEAEGPAPSGGGAAKALAEVAARWEELDREQGADAARDDYRVSVGLLPLSHR